MQKSLRLLGLVVIFIVITIVFLLFYQIVLSDRNADTKQLEQTLTRDLVADSVVEAAVVDAVKLKVLEVKDGQVSVEVTAPNISAELTKWVALAPEDSFTTENLEAKTLELLSSSTPKSNTYQMVYSEAGKQTEINYTAEYADAISCGLLSFYRTARDNAVNDLGRSAQ